MSQAFIRIPQPCPESWAAMTPTAAGRHCAACQKTVIDFTQLSDAEILEQLAHAGRGSTCGRFQVGQLERPLQARAVAPSQGWRAWLTTLAAVWGLRESAGTIAIAQHSTEQHATPEPVATPDVLQLKHLNEYEGPQLTQVLRGVVLDVATRQPISYAAVLVKGTQTSAITDTSGRFSLIVPVEHIADGKVSISIRQLGYAAEERTVEMSASAPPVSILLYESISVLSGAMVIVSSKDEVSPWPWHPRRFFNWVVRPLRRD